MDALTPTPPAEGDLPATSTAGGAPSEADKPKPKEACVACRTTKVKCKLATPESAPSDVCARCTRLKIPCVYAQARRGRKPGSKRTLAQPSPADKKGSTSSNSSEPPHKVQKRSPSTEPPNRRPSTIQHEQTSEPSGSQTIRPQQSPQTSFHRPSNAFPFHSFEQPHPPPPPPPSQQAMMHQRDPSSSSSQTYQTWPSPPKAVPARRESYNGYPPSVPPVPQWANGLDQNASLYPSQPSRQHTPSSSLSTSYQSYRPEPGTLQSGPPPDTFPSSFPPPFYASSNLHHRRPSEPAYYQSRGLAPGQRPPSSSHYTPYPPPLSHPVPQPPFSPRSVSQVPLVDGRTSPGLASLAADHRRKSSAGRQSQESFLRGADILPASHSSHPHHLPPLEPPPTDHPSAASTNASELSAASRKSLPSILSIRGLLHDVDSMSQSRSVEERELPRPPLTLAEVLDQNGGIGPSTGTGASNSARPVPVIPGSGIGHAPMNKGARWDDPLSLGMVSPDEVVALFNCFHSRLNLLIDILDVGLHTPAYTRSTSTILFTAVLCVASKVIKPGLYPSLLALCNHQLGRAFAEGVSEIGLIQALSMLAFWKESSERGSWRRVGYGIRLAIELGLHLEPKRPLPEDELEARKLLDRERTWFQLLCFDHVLSEQHNRPLMIGKEFRWDGEAWAMDHPQYHCECDPMLAASLALVRINNTAEKTRRCQDESAQVMLMSMLRTELAKWKERWVGPNPIMKMHPDCLTMTRFYSALFSFEVDVLQLEIASAGTQPDYTQMQPQTSSRGTFSGFDTASPGSEQVVAFSNCISAALAALRILVTDLPEFLFYAQDAVVFGSATVALWLVRNISRMPPLAKDAVYDVLRKATLVCRSVTKDPRDTSAYQARFFASLIHVAAASRAPSVASKPASPDSNGNTNGNGNGQISNHSTQVPTGMQNSITARRRPSDQASGLFDVYQANDAAGVDLGALDQQLEGNQMGWPFPSDLGEDENVDLDEMFADLSAWFPSTHGESLVATSGSGTGLGSGWAVGNGLPGVSGSWGTGGG